MQLIKPLEIAGKIMSLISEARKQVVIVSPYYKFTYWKKLNRVIEEAKSRQVEFIFYVRKGEWASIEEIKRIGFEPIEVEMLHAKIYLNESEAILSSMNLNMSSDNSSIDIGMITETEKEYSEVMFFYEKYIKSKTSMEYNFQFVSEIKLNKGTIIEISKIEENRRIKEMTLSSLHVGENENLDSIDLRKYHLATLKKLIQDEYFFNTSDAFFKKSVGSNESEINIVDFPITGVTLIITGVINFKFKEVKAFDKFKELYRSILDEEIPNSRIYWNRNIINIYGSKKFEFPNDEIGVINLAKSDLDVINKFIFQLRQLNNY